MNNVVGKMLVVMQLVFSILFMCFAGAVFTFQGQWRAAALDAQGKIENAEQQRKDKTEELDRVKKELTDNLAGVTAELNQLKAEIGNLNRRNDEMTEDLDQAQQARDKAIADADAANSEAKARVIESEALNKEVRSLQTRIADLTRQIQDTEDILLQSRGQVEAAKENEEVNLAEIGRLKDLLRLNDIDPDTVVAGYVAGQIEKVDGFVEDTYRTSNGEELLQITIGSDDKVMKGLNLTVSRRNKYLGQARVIRLYADKAVCLVDKKTRQGPIQVGDNVTTKL